MKQILLTTLIVLSGYIVVMSQSVGIGTSAPHPSAQLEIRGNTKGMLIPRMTSASIGNILNPAKGLMVYDTSVNDLMVNMGTVASPNWKSIAYNSSWSMKGNHGTNPETHFIGTTDNKPLNFRINNQTAGKIDSTGQVVLLGFQAGNNTNGGSTTAIGYQALRYNSAGIGNTALGAWALFQNSNGLLNCAVGYRSLSQNSVGSNNTAVGSYALQNNNSGGNNSALGSAALSSNTSGSYNTAMGYEALYFNSSGSINSAVGYRSLYSNTQGFVNTALGNYALYNNTIGNFNSAGGAEALYYNSSGTHNTAFGYEALKGNTVGGYNVALGSGALELNTNGVNNTALGTFALNKNSTGVYNTGIGYNALGGNTTGTQNTAVGLNALLSTTTASFNTAVGQDAARYHNLGWNNTFIGANCNANASNIYNSICLGQGTTVTASNQARFGNTSTTSIGGYANWSNISDGRFKKNIRDDVKGLDFIMRLRPVTYQLDVTSLNTLLHVSQNTSPSIGMRSSSSEKESEIQTGFIAQEVELAARELDYDFSGIDAPKNENDLYGLRYAEFVVPLVKAVQEQQTQIEELRQLNDALRARVGSLESNLDVRNISRR